MLLTGESSRTESVLVRAAHHPPKPTLPPHSLLARPYPLVMQPADTTHQRRAPPPNQIPSVSLSKPYLMTASNGRPPGPAFLFPFGTPSLFLYNCKTVTPSPYIKENRRSFEISLSAFATFRSSQSGPASQTPPLF